MADRSEVRHSRRASLGHEMPDVVKKGGDDLRFLRACPFGEMGGLQRMIELGDGLPDVIGIPRFFQDREQTAGRRARHFTAFVTQTGHPMKYDRSMLEIQRRIRGGLSRHAVWGLGLYAMAFSFLAYFCMYAFRKPFSVATFEGTVALPLVPAMDLKILFIISQVIGYTISKFVGIKVVSESRFAGRGRQILLMIGLAELALLGFALTPPPWSAVFLFLNGLPLGMIWGLVFGYLEGRRLSVLFGAFLSVSFIVSSGFLKSAGRMVLAAGVSEFWMPFVTGLFFLPILYLSVFCLDALPPPSKDDERLRVRREPMTKTERRRFLARFAGPVVILTAIYMFITAYRDFRDNFAREIWDALGYASSPEIFTVTEVPIAIAVLVALGGLVAIRDNRRSFVAMYVLMALGVLAIGLSTFAYTRAWISPVAWMVLNGLGLFLAYVPFGCIFYDTLIAVTGFVGTAGFMIYVSDAFGYVGSAVLLLYRNFGSPEPSWLEFFIGFSYFTCLVSLAGFAASALLLLREQRRRAEGAQAAEARVGR